MSSTLADLRKKVAEVNTKLNSGEFNKKKGSDKETREEDPRMWYPKLDENKNGYGVIRFLPPAQGSSVPWASIYFHRYKVGNRWYVEYCPTTIGLKCPVCEANSEAWKTNTEAGKKIARDRKRQLKYWYNIFVLSDPAAPENNGKNKIFKSGSKIWQMTQDALKPQFPGEVPIDAFDPWSGAPFELKIREYEGNVNYDKSDFAKSKAGSIGSDDQIEAIWKAEFDLGEFSNPSLFKPFEELKKKFDEINGEASPSSAPTRSEPPRQNAKQEEAPAPSKSLPPKAEASPPAEDGEDASAWFADFAKD